MKPVICITKGVSEVSNYTRAIELYGGEPILLGPDEKPPKFDGLLLTGGGDIHPCYYGQACHESIIYVNKRRDKLELPLCQQVLEADIPIFGICRGIQVMNVAMGENLYQDTSLIPGETLRHTRDEDYNDSRHKIEIVKESLLSQLTGECVSEVNSAHHQAVDKVADGFVVTAYTEDGVIEAIEMPSKRFALGVQYHPERMLKVPALREHARKLFEAFIDAAINYHSKLSKERG